jgi:hypothetical protein
MGIEEGERVQTKGVCNVVNKIITENYSNIEKVLLIQVQEASMIPNKHEQNQISP